MNNKPQSLVGSIYVLFFSIILLLGISFSVFEDITYYFTKIETNSTILNIHNQETDKKPYRIEFRYFNKFENKDVIAYKSVNNKFERSLFVNKNEPICFGRFFEKNVYFRDYETPAFASIIVEIFSVLFLIIAAHFSFNNIKKYRKMSGYSKLKRR